MFATRNYFVVLAMLAAGCTASTEDSTDRGNDDLGIARFAVADVGDVTTLTGLDATGFEVARLELTHGRFALTGPFREDYATAEVDGRKLYVVAGERTFLYETAGYGPVMHMPAHPDGMQAIDRFLEDPHVKPVLERWQLGFERPGSGDEQAYVNTAIAGTSQYHCTTNVPNTECGSARGSAINTCGGGYVPFDAWRVTRTTPTYTYNEYIVAQYCPAGSGGVGYNWVAHKSCPTSGTGSQPSTCGTASGACKGCGVYDASFAGRVFTTTGGIRYCGVDSPTAATCAASLEGTICGTIGPAPGECGCTCDCGGPIQERTYACSY